MPERGERNHNPEQEPNQDYYQAARFEQEQTAYGAYVQVQDLLLAHSECDLSTYRFLLNHVSHVAVLGQQPTDELEQEVQTLLAAGVSVSLPETILHRLHERRRQAMRHGPWVEGHYRPGLRLPNRGDE